MNYSKRVRINTGFVCNVKCRFCYYWDKLDIKNPSLNHIKYLLDTVRKAGMESVDFSGGESTARADFPEILSYARGLGFKNRCLQTNGLRLANKDYLKELIDSGLNEVHFSVHGCSPEEHDWLTQVPGSFEKIIKAIDNLKEFEVPFRFNVTVTKKNYKSLTKHAKLFLEKAPLQVNFILFNYWGNADKLAQTMAVKYSEAAPYIKKGIDMMKDDIKYINVRYIPFCFMKGYEKYVTNHGQTIFDPFEWNPIAMSKTHGGIKRHYLRLLYYFFRCFPFESTRGLKLNFFQRILVSSGRFNTYTKSKACKKCKYYKICDGPEKQYVNMIGFGELRPEGGDYLKDLLYYRKDFNDGLDPRFL